MSVLTPNPANLSTLEQWLIKNMGLWNQTAREPEPALPVTNGGTLGRLYTIPGTQFPPPQSGDNQGPLPRGNQEQARKNM